MTHWLKKSHGTPRRSSGRARQLRLESLEARQFLSGNPRLVKDINLPPESLGSDPGAVIAAGSQVFFAATDQTAGRELWVTDGSAAGTHVVEDIRPGVADANPRQLTAIGNLVYFVADDASGSELWRSDGTEAGTFALTDVNSGSGLSQIRSLTAHGNVLYFAAPGSFNGSTQLWRTDGTVAGTILVKDIALEGGATSIHSIVVVGGSLYFANGASLWKSDGSTGGTSFVPLPVGVSTPSQLTDVNGTLFFVAYDNDHAYEVWKTDGTDGGTAPVTDLEPTIPAEEQNFSYGPIDLTNVNGVLYFFYATVTSNFQLWTATGQPGAATLVEDFGANGAVDFPTNPASFAGELYFGLWDVDDYQLWKSNGTELGTAPFDGDWSSYGEITTTVLDGVLYIQLDAFYGRELRKLDGSVLGFIVPNNTIYIGNGRDPSLAALGGSLYFPGSDAVHGVEIWKSNGAPGGAALLKDVNLRAEGSWLFNMQEHGGLSYFTVDIKGVRALWRTDGTTAGTINVDALLAGNGTLERALQVAHLGGSLYFSRHNGAGGVELWTAQPNGAGAACVEEIMPGSAAGYLLQFTSAGGLLYFFAYRSDDSRSLWRTDGTPAGTVELESFAAQPYGGFAVRPTRIGNRIYFTAITAGAGHELWTSDGTPGGTHIVKDINVGPAHTTISDFVDVDGRLFFVASDVAGSAIWTSDGTELGTIKLNQLLPLTGFLPYPQPTMAAFNGQLYFFVNSSGSIAELWKSDGSLQGTTAVRNFNKTGPSDILRQLTVAGDRLYFQNNDGLWTSNGSGGGTSLIPTPAEGPLIGMRDFTSVGDRLYFYAYNQSAGGIEIWSTDGTVTGLERQTDFPDPTGTSSGFQQNLLGVLGSQLFFTADDGVHGRELFALNTAPSGSGDFNGDGLADGADFLAWQRALGGTAAPIGAGADGDASGTIDAGDLSVWRDRYGTAASAAAAAPNALIGAAEQSSEFRRNSPTWTSFSETRFPASEQPDNNIADAVYAAGDFTSLFAAAADDSGPTRSYRPRRRR